MALEITWFTRGVNDNMPGIPLKTETITLSGTHAESNPAPDDADVVWIQATENARYAVGTAPVATATAGTSGHYLASGTNVWIPVRGNSTKISGIQAS